MPSGDTEPNSFFPTAIINNNTGDLGKVALFLLCSFSLLTDETSPAGEVSCRGCFFVLFLCRRLLAGVLPRLLADTELFLSDDGAVAVDVLADQIVEK